MPPFFRRRQRRQPQSAAPPSPQPSRAPGTPPEDPTLAHAWFCDRLPLLRAEADQHNWRRELEEQVTALREGRPVADVLDTLLLSPHGTVRSADNLGGGTPLRDVWDSAPIGQRFHCPRSVCPPRGRAEDASEPWCHLDDEPLSPTTYRLDS